jgi:hypothetical protein
MKSVAILSFIICLLFRTDMLSAQMVGTDIFLQGTYLEIGQNDLGAFGSSAAAPTSYHPYPGGPLAEVYDYGHDGWAAGSPPYYGDYTLPHANYDGWGIQVNRLINWAVADSPAIFGTGSLTGHNTSYTATGTSVIANWAGTAAGGDLVINMQTRIDLNSSWATVTVKFYNSSISRAAPSIYYMRICSPHNDETHNSNPATRNIISYQHDTANQLMVSSAGLVDPGAFLGLGTIDTTYDRAVAFIYDSIPLCNYVTDFSDVWLRTYCPYGAEYAPGISDTGSKGIGIIYKIGDLEPGDSTSLSYAYIFNGVSGIDSAFREIGPTTTSVWAIQPLSSIQLSPNPAQNELTVTSSDKIKSIAITDLIGQTLLTQYYNEDKVNINVANLPSGLYLVRVNGTQVSQFVKQ